MKNDVLRRSFAAQVVALALVMLIAAPQPIWARFNPPAWPPMTNHPIATFDLPYLGPDFEYRRPRLMPEQPSSNGRVSRQLAGGSIGSASHDPPPFRSNPAQLPNLERQFGLSIS